MSDGKTGVIIPAGIAPKERQILSESLKEAIHASPPALKGDVEVIEVRARGLLEVGTVGALLLVSGGASVWFTKKWADEYLWPIIKRKIDRPSKALTGWLDGIFASSAGNEAKSS